MIKNDCNAIAIVVGILPIWLRNLKKEFLFILYDPLVHLLNYRTVNNHAKLKMQQYF